MFRIETRWTSRKAVLSRKYAGTAKTMNATASTGLTNKRKHDVGHGESGCHHCPGAVVERVGEVGKLDGGGVVEVPDAPLREVLVVGPEKLVDHPGLDVDHETGDLPGDEYFLSDDQCGPERVEGGHCAKGKRQSVLDAEIVEGGRDNPLQRRVGIGASDYREEQPESDSLQRRCQNDQREPYEEPPPQGGVEVSDYVGEIPHGLSSKSKVDHRGYGSMKSAFANHFLPLAGGFS